MVAGVAGGVERLEPPTAAEVDGVAVGEGAHARRVGGEQAPEQLVEHRSEHPGSACQQAARVDEVAGAGRVHDHLRPGECRGQVADAAGVVEVDVRDHDRGEVVRPDAQGLERADHLVGRRGRARLDERRTLASDQVAGGDPVVPAHPGVDEPDVVPEVDRFRGAGRVLVHSCSSWRVVPSPSRYAGARTWAVPRSVRPGDRTGRVRRAKEAQMSAAVKPRNGSGGTADEPVNEVRLRGRLAGDPEERELPSGDRVVVLRSSSTGRRGHARATTPSTAPPTPAVRRRLLRWRHGDVVEVHGSLHRRFFRAGAGPVSRYEVDVAAARRVATAAAGRGTMTG